MRFCCCWVLLLSFAFADAQTLEVDAQTLRENPELLATALDNAVFQGRAELAADLLALYRGSADADPQLVRFSEALLARERGDYAQAAALYRAMLAQDETLLPVRHQLAQVLLLNHREREAQRELEILAAEELPPEYAQDVAQMREIVAKRSAWNFSGGVSYLRHRNVNGAPLTTREIDFGGAAATFPDPKRGHGLRGDFRAGKDILLDNGFYLPQEVQADIDWYANASEASDYIFRLKSGVGWRDATRQIQWQPYVSRRLLGGEAYSFSYGVEVGWRHSFHPQWQLRLDGSIGRERYDHRQHLQGSRLSAAVTLLYAPNAQQYYFLNQYFYRHNARDSDEAYGQVGIGFGTGQTLSGGLEVTAGLNYGRRRYDAPGFFLLRGMIEGAREDHIYRLRWGVGHEKVHFFGISPQLVLQLERTDSNYFYFDKPREVQLLLEARKQF